MILGGYGKIAFETSADKVLTFRNFRRDCSNNVTVHEVIGQKGKSEFISPGLDIVSFEVVLHASLGYAPNDVIDQFIIHNRNGDAFPLVIGPKTIGVDKWMLRTVGIPVNTFGKFGEIISSIVELSFEEYVEGL